jgi:hypothetical protein
MKELVRKAFFAMGYRVGRHTKLDDLRGLIRSLTAGRLWQRPDPHRWRGGRWLLPFAGQLLSGKSKGAANHVGRSSFD